MTCVICVSLRASVSESFGKKTAKAYASRVAVAKERQYRPPKNPTRYPGTVSSMSLGIAIAIIPTEKP